MIKNLSFTVLTFLSLGSLAEINAQCTAVDSFNENFDALSCCAFNVVPPCWNSLSTPNGNQIISTTTPASGGSNVYQFGYGNNVKSVVIMPPLTNVNAGTHHFKFKVRVNSNPGLLDFGYMTNPNDIDSFVTLESLTITNTTYNNSERTLNVPTSVPANAQLAIRNSGATFGQHYWDDAVWEAKSNLSVNDLKTKPVKIYPNPASDYVEISNPEKIREISISDASGRTVKNISQPDLKISVEDFPAGIYYLNISFKNDSKTVVEKIIKRLKGLNI